MTASTLEPHKTRVGSAVVSGLPVIASGAKQSPSRLDTAMEIRVVPITTLNKLSVIPAKAETQGGGA